jgi:hypothetical protein
MHATFSSQSQSSEWEKPAAAMVLPGSSGSADSNRRSDEQDGDLQGGRQEVL